jgi:hypothetical protein
LVANLFRASRPRHEKEAIGEAYRAVLKAISDLRAAGVAVPPPLHSACDTLSHLVRLNQPIAKDGKP